MLGRTSSCLFPETKLPSTLLVVYAIAVFVLAANLLANELVSPIGLSTVCQATGTASRCLNEANVWVNLHKSLTSIAVTDNHVWGIDHRGVLWYLPDSHNPASWTRICPEVMQISAGHNLVCQINRSRHLLCAVSPDLVTKKLRWIDTGPTTFKQIAVSAGKQLWGVDRDGRLFQIADYARFSSTSIFVASGVEQVAVDGRGLICRHDLNQDVYCSSWSAPAAAANSAGEHILPWVKLPGGLHLQTIAAADGQVWGVSAGGDLWQLPDYTNRSTWLKIAPGSVSDNLAASAIPSRFSKSDFAANEVAVLLFMGQSNAVGYNTLPPRFIPQSLPNVWGVRNDGWNFLPGNKNGTVPFTKPIASIGSVEWSPFSLKPDGPDMNLGFNSNAGPGGNAANFAASQWQGLINAGWPLPDLYIIHIAWPSQGVDPTDAITADVPWVKHGINLWQPDLTAAKLPSYALAPFARRIVYLALQRLLATGKIPRIIGMQWNQWEAEAGNANPVTMTNAPGNYARLFKSFYAAVGTRYPIQITKPLAPYYSASVLKQMQKVFNDLAADDPDHISIIDVSRVSKAIFKDGVLGGGDGSVHYNLDTQQWFAKQAIGLCLENGTCGTRITTLPPSAPN
jgi:hypothetical protein